MPVSITRLESILLARHVALPMDHVAQQKRSIRRTRRSVSEMQLLVTRSRRPREIGMQRKAALRCYECEGFGNFGRECPMRQKRQNGSTKEGGTQRRVRGVHGPPAKGPHLKRTGRAKWEPRVRETRESGKRQRRSPQRFRKCCLYPYGSHHIGEWYANYICRSRRNVQGPDNGHWIQYFIMQPGIVKSNVQVTTMEPYWVTGDNLDMKGQQTVTFRMKGKRLINPFLVCSPPPQQMVYWAPISWVK